jgi:hypothetical protein
MASLSKKKSGRTEKQRSERSYLISTWKSEMAAWPIYFSSEDRQAIAKNLAVSDPNMFRDLIDINRTMPKRCGDYLLLHRTSPSMSKYFISVG